MDSIRKKLLLAILIVLILIIIVTIYLIYLNLENKQKNINNIITDEPIESEEKPQDSLVDYTKINKYNSYFMFDLEDKINLLFDYIEDNKVNEANSLLSNEYKNSSNLDLNFSEFFIQEVYSSENEYNGKFYIYGLAKKEDINTTLEDIYFIIDVYYINSTFEIKLSNETTFRNAKNGIGEQVKYKTIEKNGYNRIEISNMTTEQLVKKYIRDYKNKALYKPEYAYNLLSSENKTNQFNTQEAYIQYIQNNRENIENMSLSTYNKEIKDEYIEYNVLCNDNSAYIIKSHELMNYTIWIK